MLCRKRVLSSILACSAFAALLFCTAQRPRALGQEGKSSGVQLFFEERKFNRKELKGLFSGDRQMEEQDKGMIDDAAKYYSYRLTFLEYQQPKPGARGMNYLVQEAEQELEANRKAGKDIPAVKLFNGLLHKHLKEVLPNPKPIAAMNAARILAKMGAVGEEEVTDTLAELVKDPKANPGSRYWAARGLQNFFQLAFPAADTEPVLFKDKEREARCILALLTALDLKLPESPPPLPEEIEGHRILRREVIRALGLSRYPAVVDGKGEVEGGKTALALVRVLRNDGFNPPPRLDEQVEAAIGICRLQARPSKDYKLAHEYRQDVAAFQVGQFVDLFTQARSSPPERQPLPPWKTSAARLSEALRALQADVGSTKDKELIAYVNPLIAQCLPVLKAIEGGTGGTSGSLHDYLQKNSREDAELFKGDKKSVLKTSTGKPDEAPEKP
jgi:hypothetical protein